MAATKVATLHPHHNPLNSQSSPFDEFLNLPPSPQLSHPSPSPLALSPPQTQSSAPSISKLATSSHHGSSIAASSSPPPPGSSPESLFRYYLAAELRKAGTNPDDALLDKYVKNHFDSLFKTKPLARSSASTIQVGGSNADPKRPATLSAPSQTPVFDQPDLISEQDVLVATDDPALQELQATSSPSLSAMSARSFTPLATPPMEELNADQLFPRAFKHSSPSLEVSTFNPMSFASTSNDVIQASNANQQPIPQPGTQQQHQPSSIDPHLVELTSVHQPFSMSRMAPLYGNPDSSKYSRNHRHSTTSDAMSEDSGDDAGEDEDDKSKLAHLVNASGSQSLSTSQFMPFKPMRLGTTAAPSEATKPTKAAASETKPVSKIISSANDLKPNPEEYKKLSSKEKRQLRNKISARNFRTRRKEYIGQLEEQLADRDTVIEGLRQQLAQLTTQNKSLQEEVRVLKTKSISPSDVARILEALQKSITPSSGPGSDTPATIGSAPLSFGGDVQASQSSSGSRPQTPVHLANVMVPSSPRPMSPRPPAIQRRSSPSITQPNTKKDIAPSAASASSSAANARSFWGGVGGGNHFMSVHTTLIPEVRLQLPSLGDQLSRMMDDSLSIGTKSTASKLEADAMNKKKKQQQLMYVRKEKEGKFDVYDTFASLLSEDHEGAPPPPTYSEAIAPTSAAMPASASASKDIATAIIGGGSDPSKMSDCVRKALDKALAPSSSQAAVPSSGKASYSGHSTFDMNKLMALMEGKAELILVDKSTGKPWDRDLTAQSGESEVVEATA